MGVSTETEKPNKSFKRTALAGRRLTQTVRPLALSVNGVIKPRVTWLRRTVAAARLRSMRWRTLYGYIAAVSLTERRKLPPHERNWWRRLRLQAVRVYEARFGPVPPVLRLCRLPQRPLHRTKDWPNWGRMLHTKR